jgi:hypothetical protein
MMKSITRDCKFFGARQLILEFARAQVDREPRTGGVVQRRFHQAVGSLRGKRFLIRVSFIIVCGGTAL